MGKCTRMTLPASTLWRMLFLAEKYGRMTMTLEEVAEQIGMAPGTIRNRRSRGEFAWIKQEGRTLSSDVADVAAYIGNQWGEASAAVAAVRAMLAAHIEPSEFLTTDELRDLTQRARRDAQVKELQVLGIPHLVQRGRVLVSRVHVRERIAGNTPQAIRRPDLSKVR